MVSQPPSRMRQIKRPCLDPPFRKDLVLSVQWTMNEQRLLAWFAATFSSQILFPIPGGVGAWPVREASISTLEMLVCAVYVVLGSAPIIASDLWDKESVVTGLGFLVALYYNYNSARSAQ
jgi:hypothetical protein